MQIFNINTSIEKFNSIDLSSECPEKSVYKKEFIDKYTKALKFIFVSPERTKDSDPVYQRLLNREFNDKMKIFDKDVFILNVTISSEVHFKGKISTTTNTIINSIHTCPCVIVIDEVYGAGIFGHKNYSTKSELNKFLASISDEMDAIKESEV